MGKVVDDFYDSDAPQFKGKSKKKRRQMAIAAKLSADESYTEKSMERTQRLPGKPNTLCGTGGYLKNAMKATGTKKIKNYKEATTQFRGEKQKRKDAAREQENTDRNLRMKHGKKWKDYTKDSIAAKEREKNRLKTGEVKRYDKKKQKWVSNKD